MVTDVSYLVMVRMIMMMRMRRRRGEERREGGREGGIELPLRLKGGWCVI
jgi:hypothetical protein